VEFDRASYGIVSQVLILFAASPGGGKTALSLSIIYNTSVLGKIPCAMFSLEMDGVQLVRRLTSIDTGIPHEKIRNGHTTNNEELMLAESVEKIVNSSIYIEDKTSMNIRDIRTKASILKKKYDIGYIVVDYIQLMSGIDAKGKNREQVVSDISRGLKCIAKELEIPVIALSQLSRAVESRPDKMPQLSDLRESGAIEQDADSVLFLMRPEYYSMTEPILMKDKEYPVQGLAICSIAKNRHGSTKNIPMEFVGNTMKFKTHYLTSQHENRPLVQSDVTF
jgi:replicative DNA helicase